MRVFRPNGSVLIFTLWIILIVAVLALGLAYTARLEVKTVSYSLDELKTHYILKGGINKVLNRLKENYDIKGYDTRNSYKRFEGKQYSLGGGSWEIIKIADEETKININIASKQILLKIPQVTEGVANYILNKRPFKNIESLILSKALTEEEVKELREKWITVYGDGKINFNTCENYILDLLRGLTSLKRSILKDKICEELDNLKYSCCKTGTVNVNAVKKEVFKAIKEVKNSQDSFRHMSVVRGRLNTNDGIEFRKEQLRKRLKEILYNCCMAKADRIDKGTYCKTWAKENSGDIKKAFFSHIIDTVLKYLEVKSSNYRMTIRANYQNIEKKVSVVGNKFNKIIKYWYSHYYSKYE